MFVEFIFSVMVSFILIALSNFNLGVIVNSAIPIVILASFSDLTSKELVFATILWVGLLFAGEYVNKNFSFRTGLTGLWPVDNFLFMFGMVMGQFTK